MAQTLIQKLASIDVGSVIEVMPRKGFKDPDFTPVGGSTTPISAIVLGKNSNVLTLDLGQNMIFNFDVKKDITFKVLSTLATKEDVIATKAKLATITPAGTIQSIVLFFVSIFSKTETKTRFLVHHQVTEALSIEELRTEIQHFCTLVNVAPATHVIWKAEDGSAKGGFNLTTWANMKPVTEWTLVRSEDLPFIVALSGAGGLKIASQDIKDRAVTATTDRLLALKAIHGDNLRVMSGMSEGYDELGAMLAIKLEIKLILAIPNKGYGAYYWGRKSLTSTDRMNHFNGIIARADKVVYVMEEIHNTRDLYLNGRHANFIRNDYMVAQANHFLVWDPSSSGTRDCLATIVKSGKPFEILSGDNDECPSANKARKAL